MRFGPSASSAGGSNRQLRPTGHYTSVTPLTVNGASRQVSVATQVIASINIAIGILQTGNVNIQLSSDNTNWQTIATQSNASLASLVAFSNAGPCTFEVPAGWYYRFTGTGGTPTVTLMVERQI